MVLYLNTDIYLYAVVEQEKQNYKEPCACVSPACVQAVNVPRVVLCGIITQRPPLTLFSWGMIFQVCATNNLCFGLGRIVSSFMFVVFLQVASWLCISCTVEQ